MGSQILLSFFFTLKIERIGEIELDMPKSTKDKKTKGQFYTTKAAYILEGMAVPPDSIRCVEPFAGKGDLLGWLKEKGYKGTIDAFDIDPKSEGTHVRDTLKNPPDYTNAWILTNPPYLARNKCNDKEIYDKYNTNDLYKCFMTSVSNQDVYGGLLIIPSGFFFSPRDIDVRCRNEFMKKYKIMKVKFFEETVFEDTSTTVVVVAFERANTILQEQDVPWEVYPSRFQNIFHVSSKYDWIIGGEIYSLPVPTTITVRRHVEGQPLKTGEQQTNITLQALDSGAKDGKICLTYDKNYIYPAKDCSRAYATIRITGKYLSEEEQIDLCRRFNEFLEAKRQETYSLFLPQFRESKEYARKRIPFELAYRILLHLLF
jgi:hypothetical protein